MDVRTTLRKHPWFTAILVIGAAGGAVFSWYFAPQDLTPARRIIGGIIAGLGIALTIVLTRVLGAFQDDSADKPD